MGWLNDTSLVVKREVYHGRKYP